MIHDARKFNQHGSPLFFRYYHRHSQKMTELSIQQ
jgi:hypothetical protein